MKVAHRVSVLVLAMMTAGLSAFAGGTNESDSGTSQEAFTLRAAHQLPTGTPFDKGLNKFAELVAEKTDGQVEVVVYPNAQLGGDADLYQGLEAGTIDIAATGAGSLGDFEVAFNLLTMPFLISSRQDAEAVISGQGAELISQRVEENSDVRIIGWFGGGIRNMFFTRPANSLEDVQGRRFRVHPSPVLTDSFSAFGLQPVVISYQELYNALQQGVVGGAENESVYVLSQRFYEPAKYLLLTRHIVTVQPFMISKRTIDRLPPELLPAILEAAEEAAVFQRQTEAQADDEALNTLINEYGMVVSEVETSEMVRLASEVWHDYAERWEAQDVLDAILQDTGAR